MKILIAILSFLLTISCEGQSNKKDIKVKTKVNSTSLTSKNTKQLKCGDVIFFNPTKNLWKNFKIGNADFKKINSENSLYFVDDCNSIIVSPDKRVYLLREILNAQFQNNYDTYEAPYIGFDVKTQGEANYASIIDGKIIFLSLSNDKAYFVSQHDFMFKNNIYHLSDELLKRIPNLIRNNILNFNSNNIKEYLNTEPLSDNNVKEYNDIAYYLSEKKIMKNHYFF